MTESVTDFLKPRIVNVHPVSFFPTFNKMFHLYPSQRLPLQRGVTVPDCSRQSGARNQVWTSASMTSLVLASRSVVMLLMSVVTDVVSNYDTGMVRYYDMV